MIWEHCGEAYIMWYNENRKCFQDQDWFPVQTKLVKLSLKHQIRVQLSWKRHILVGWNLKCHARFMLLISKWWPAPLPKMPASQKQHQLDFYYQKGEFLLYRMQKICLWTRLEAGVWCELWKASCVSSAEDRLQLGLSFWHTNIEL